MNIKNMVAILTALLLNIALLASGNTEIPVYMDPNKHIDDRVEDLLNRMTLPEKVGQMMQLDGHRGDLDDYIHRMGIGSMLHIQNEEAAVAMRMAAKTRLGIPILFADDCIHGHSFHPGATIFPTQLGMACSWNPEHIQTAARITAIEARLTGLKWTFSPVLDVARDLRWGRVGETFGEDPFLNGEFGAAMIRGYQGNGLDDPESILATAKHYAGYSETQGGRDSSEADLSRRKLKSYFLPPFQRAAEAGCRAFMTGYQSTDGVPITLNKWLLKDVLRDSWGFSGVLVTDWDNVGRLVREQMVCETYTEAAALAIQSGNDLMMSTPEFYDGAIEAVEKGMIEEAEIDAIVRRLLKLKYQLGLFEDPGYPDLEAQKRVINCDAHQQANLDFTRECIVLLQNDGLLPLSQETPIKIAVVGPNADDAQAQMGDWAGATGQVSWSMDGHPRELSKTVLDGLRDLAPAGSSVIYARGADIASSDEEAPDYDDGQVRQIRKGVAKPDPEMIAEAVEAAKASDLVVAVVGDMVQFFGETKSTATLELLGGQKALLDALAETEKPMVVVMISSKPLIFPDSALQSSAIIQAFSPGMTGGTAIAETLFGMNNPSGRLTISFPYHVGQQPIFYNQVRGQHGTRYADLTQEPMFAFGEGLSYSRFVYSDLQILNPVLTEKDMFKCSVMVSNESDVDGESVVQLYVSDLVTSATWVSKELKGFQKVFITAHTSKRVNFEIPAENFSIVNAMGERLVEPGKFEVQVGPNSRDENLLKAQFEIKR